MKLSKVLSCLGLLGILCAHSNALPQSKAPALPNGSFHLMPVPYMLTPAEGKFRIIESLSVTSAGHSEPRLTKAVERFLHRLEIRTGIRHTGTPPAGSQGLQLVIECAGPGEPVQTVRAEESYTLEVGMTKVRLAAPSPLGIMHGLETVLQLLDLDAESFYLPAVAIQDRPRFPWRGLMIDVARHWQPVEVIKRNLDAMAAVKLNVFHWHLSEDQGFRVESKRYPRLQGLGSDGLKHACGGNTSLRPISIPASGPGQQP